MSCSPCPSGMTAPLPMNVFKKCPKCTMKLERPFLGGTAILMAQLLLAFSTAHGHSLNNQSVSARIERVAAGSVGRLGVAAQEIQGQEVVAINGHESFVMASSYKVAIATAVLDRVDKGELRLDQLVTVTPDRIIAADSVIAEQFVHPGIQLSLANLIEAMITESDNTATDLCMELAGGPAAVTKKLRSIGITDQRVDRPVAEGLRDFYGLPAPGTASVAAEFFKNNPAQLAVAAQLKPNPAFEKDPRDQTTPLAMLQLLLAIDSSKALSPESREFLLGSMSRTRTGAGRLKGLLPKGTPVAHKTGTIGGVANDVGYITLPDGRRFAVAVYTNSSETPVLDRDRAIAEVARMLYDYFYLRPVAK